MQCILLHFFQSFLLLHTKSRRAKKKWDKKCKFTWYGKKRGREVPGPLKKVLVLLDFFGPGTTGPSRSLDPVLSRDLPMTSRDGTVLLPTLVWATLYFYVRSPWSSIPCWRVLISWALYVQSCKLMCNTIYTIFFAKAKFKQEILQTLWDTL